MVRCLIAASLTENQMIPLGSQLLSAFLSYINILCIYRLHNVCIWFCLHCCVRIQKNMLMDLSKDIMMDLGITVIGDIIAILKHAKQVHRQVRQESMFIVLGCWVLLHQALTNETVWTRFKGYEVLWKSLPHTYVYYYYVYFFSLSAQVFLTMNTIFNSMLKTNSPPKA